MVNTIKAFKSVFNLMLSIVQLIIGISFAIQIFSRDSSVGGSIIDAIENFLVFSSIFSALEIDGPISFLLIILAYMLFGVILFSQIPRILKQGNKPPLFEED